MAAEKYVMSFTAGALLSRESVTVAELHGELGDWEAVREKVISENRLQMRTLSASRRIFREVSTRLKSLTTAEMELLLDGSRQEQNYLLWLGICKWYRFIHEFAVQVVREKYLRLDLDLSYDEYDAFFNDRAEWHSEVERLAPSTRVKQREVVFRMMREAALLTRHRRIIPAMLTPQLIELIVQDSPNHLAIYPVSDLDVKEWLT
jgi:hypothetical protein